MSIIRRLTRYYQRRKNNRVKAGFARCGENVTLGNNLFFMGREFMTIGSGSSLADGLVLTAWGGV